MVRRSLCDRLSYFTFLLVRPFDWSLYERIPLFVILLRCIILENRMEFVMCTFNLLWFCTAMIRIPRARRRLFVAFILCSCCPRGTYSKRVLTGFSNRYFPIIRKHNLCSEQKFKYYWYVFVSKWIMLNGCTWCFTRRNQRVKYSCCRRLQ